MESDKNTAVISVIGKDRVGIIAGVSALLSENNININDISQTILDDIFTMIMLVDLKDNDIENSDIADKLSALGDELGVVITIQHTDLFNRMHRI
ncbi:MAG: ACT domain-containing protein [Saccharofermentans sp.]|jgi:ACT domain-containing protein|nr:ACT domain-containing protein [Saccharofermentans sp.]